MALSSPPSTKASRGSDRNLSKMNLKLATTTTTSTTSSSNKPRPPSRRSSSNMEHDEEPVDVIFDPNRGGEISETLNLYQQHRRRCRRLSLTDSYLYDSGMERLTEIVQQGGSDVCLQSLDLSCSRITSSSSACLSTLLGTIDQTLQELDLSNNKEVKAGLEEIIQSLQRSTRLKRLDLTNTGLGARGIQRLETLLQRHASLEELRLGKNGLQNKHAVRRIFFGCRDNVHLRILDLSNNLLNDASVKCLAGLLDSRKYQSRLVELDLSNELEPSKGNCITAKGIKYLKDALIQGNNTALTRLKLSGNDLGVEGGRELGCLLRVSHTITELHVGACKLNDEGVEHICNGLKTELKEPVLRYLDVSWNVLKDKAATFLADLMERSTTLQVLNISDNAIGDKGAEDLARALPRSQTLLELDVGKNHFGDQGAVTLAVALSDRRCSSSLQVHYMNEHMTDLGLRRLAGAIQLRKSRVEWLDKVLGKVRDGCPLLLCKLGDDELVEICNAVASTGYRSYKFTMARFEGTMMITSRGVGAVTNHLMLSPGVVLEKLLFLRTHMGDQGAALLANALVNNDTLISLACQDCELTDKGAIYFARALLRNRTIARLDLSQNLVGGEGARELFKAVEHAPSLDTLILASNNIDNSALLSISSFGQLLNLNLSHNCLTDEGALNLAHSCHGHNMTYSNSSEPSHRLKWLRVRHNFLTEKGLQALKDILCSQEGWPQKSINI